MKNTDYTINRIKCEFNDKHIENEYFDKSMKKDMKYFRPLIILVGILFILFMIPEYMFLTDEANSMQLHLIRGLTLLIIVCFYIMIGKSRDNVRISHLISMLEIVLAVSYFLLMSRHSNAEYFIKILDFIVLTMVIYILPNKFINKVVVATVFFISFFVVANITIDCVSIQRYMAGMVYSLCIIIAMSVTYYRMNYYDRLNFINERELKILSETDHLTGIYNRIKFDYELNRWIRHKARYKGALSLIMMDFDEFKLVNDRYGHLAGDQVLKDGVDVIRKMVRTTDVFARWGGEEFIMLLPETGCDKAVALAERIRKAFEEHEFHTGDKVTCSFGVVEVVEGETMQNAVNRADELLYTAKRNGRNRVERQEK